MFSFTKNIFSLVIFFSLGAGSIVLPNPKETYEVPHECCNGDAWYIPKVAAAFGITGTVLSAAATYASSRDYTKLPEHAGLAVLMGFTIGIVSAFLNIVSQSELEYAQSNKIRAIKELNPAQLEALKYKYHGNN